MQCEWVHRELPLAVLEAPAPARSSGMVTDTATTVASRNPCDRTLRHPRSATTTPQPRAPAYGFVGFDAQEHPAPVPAVA